MAKIVILGAGVMGSAFAVPAADNGHEVHLVGTHLDGAWIESIQARGYHPKLKCHLPEGIRAHTHDRFTEALGRDTDLICLGVNSAGVEWAVAQLAQTLRRPIPIVMITKGLRGTDGGFEIFPRIVARDLDRAGLGGARVAAVGGPCIAGELAARRETGVVFTHDDADFLAWLRELMTNARYYHVATSTDVQGVEACAAWKNFYALSIGIPEGLRGRRPAAENGARMHNPEAFLFAQAVREMRILAAFMGGDPDSVAGMAGAGDLYVTCQGGRNSRMGRRLGAGELYRDVMAGPMRGETIEGAELALAVGEHLEALCATGTLPGSRLPLARALSHAIVQSVPLDIPWADFLET